MRAALLLHVRSLAPCRDRTFGQACHRRTLRGSDRTLHPTSPGLDGNRPISSHGWVFWSFHKIGDKELKQTHSNNRRNARLKAAAALLSGAVLTAMMAQLAQATPINVTTFNIRNSNQSSWGPGLFTTEEASRRGRVLTSMLANNPDLIGLQEVTPEQLGDIAQILAPLGYVGYSEEREPGGESSSIFVNANRFTFLEADSFYLSLTPERQSRHALDGATESPRITSYVKLRDKTDNRDLFFANTHFQTLDKTLARNGVSSAFLKQATDDTNVNRRETVRVTDLLFAEPFKFDGGGWLDNDRVPGSGDILAATLQSIAGDTPLILTGDFNTTSSQFAYDILTGAADTEYVTGFGLNDTYADANGGEAAVATGHTTFAADPDEERALTDTPKVNGPRVDYIFASDDFNTEASVIDRRQFFQARGAFDTTPDFWKYASDHYAVTSRIDWAPTISPPPPPPPPMAPVPVPAGLPLLLGGVGAFFVMRRAATRRTP